jgi:uncharacterized RDD family membrane protein YckC
MLTRRVALMRANQRSTRMAEDVEYAGFWIRFVAFIIDSILMAAILFPLLIGLYGREYIDAMLGLAAPISGPVDILLSYVLPAVAVIVFWIYKAATPGKMIVSAKIVDATTGANPTVGQSIGRYLAYYISIFSLFIGFLWIAFDRRKQGFHDKLANTVVIRTRRSAPG